MASKETRHTDSSGQTTWVKESDDGHGGKNIVVSRGSEDIFGMRGASIVSETHVDKYGNSHTKNR